MMVMEPRADLSLSELLKHVTVTDRTLSNITDNLTTNTIDQIFGQVDHISEDAATVHGIAFSDDGEASGAGVGDTILDQHIIDQLLGIGLAEDTTAAYQGEKQYDQQR